MKDRITPAIRQPPVTHHQVRSQPDTRRPRTNSSLKARQPTSSTNAGSTGDSAPKQDYVQSRRSARKVVNTVTTDRPTTSRSQSNERRTNGKPAQVRTTYLLDTGSHVSIRHRRGYRKQVATARTCNSNIILYNLLLSSVKINDKMYSFYSYAAEIPYPILGMDFLLTHASQIDFIQSVINTPPLFSLCLHFRLNFLEFPRCVPARGRSRSRDSTS